MRLQLADVRVRAETVRTDLLQIRLLPVPLLRGVPVALRRPVLFRLVQRVELHVASAAEESAFVFFVLVFEHEMALQRLPRVQRLAASVARDPLLVLVAGAAGGLRVRRLRGVQSQLEVVAKRLVARVAPDDFPLLYHYRHGTVYDGHHLAVVVAQQVSVHRGRRVAGMAAERAPVYA